ncbi:MAG: FAD-dependent oxidoreductase [Candidatus Coatesbacteria bacterium]|nr:FAD-dependent oxidoreductase [Candidatus Coatesbacteria bacterium]
MTDFRVRTHPVLDIPEREELEFTFDGKPIIAKRGEVISSALFAAGIKVFGRHPRDGAPMGIFCANGQCSQCMVIADGVAVKACMTLAREGMVVGSCVGDPALPPEDRPVGFEEIKTFETEVLIIGGGPSGLCAAIELGRLGIETLLVDDKEELGGKLSLQTHAFFGSIDDCFAGTRGNEIGHILANEVNRYDCVETWTGSTAVGVFSDKRVGIQQGQRYVLVHPRIILISTGAREKNLSFPGCDLPGVYGAGAFQTLVNRDLVRPTDRLFIVGGGNVGLIAAYHAIQAGIEVVGLVEALPKCGGYKVHLDKILRLGVPVYTSHTVVRAFGETDVRGIEIAQVDKSFKVVEGTTRSFEVDTILVAVGLSPLDELYNMAEEAGVPVLSAGDAQEIAEASAAMFSGRLSGRKIAKMLGKSSFVPATWEPLMKTLRSKPGATTVHKAEPKDLKVYPVIRCFEEIPCNPCTQVCPMRSIKLSGNSITDLPVFDGRCTGCGRCVSICPGLAITLVTEDYDPDKKFALVIMPSETDRKDLLKRKIVTTTNLDGQPVGEGKIIAVKKSPILDKRDLLMLEVPYEQRLEVAGFKLQRDFEQWNETGEGFDDGDVIVCRCERITRREIVQEIRRGVRDMNQLKASLRTGMGACGGKTCTELIQRIFREEGVPLNEVTPPTERPFVAEVPLSALACVKEGSE